MNGEIIKKKCAFCEKMKNLNRFERFETNKITELLINDGILNSDGRASVCNTCMPFHKASINDILGIKNEYDWRFNKN